MEENDGAEMNFPHPGMTMTHDLAGFFEAHAGIVETVASCDLKHLVASVAGLLTSPEWQASTFRLEVLQHIVVASARGQAKAKHSDFKAWLTGLGEGFAGMMEDPSEDVFAARVLAAGENFLIFEGIYETAAFLLQRFLDVLAGMPVTEPFANVRRSVLALLRISDEVARRSGVTAFMTGETMPLREVPIRLVRQISHRANRALFTIEDLEGLGISLDDLAPFIFDPANAANLRAEHLGHSSLERAPMVLVNETIILALPTSVSEAIKRFLIEFCASSGLLKELYASYAYQLSRVFSQTPLMGGTMGPKLTFQMRKGIRFANIAQFVDRGRLLHICFVVDDFSGFDDGDLIMPSPDSDRIGEAVQESLVHVHADMSERDKFKEAISLVVIGSWSRPIVIGFEGLKDKRWRIETISAADLETLSWTSEFKPLFLWRLLDSRERLKNMNLNLVNFNGLLNLQGWAENLNGHLVPHGRIPEDHDLNQLVQFMVPQNNQLELRRRAAASWNVHYARTWDGRTVRVRRDQSESYFEEGQNEPLYVSMDDLLDRGKLAAVYETPQRSWWVMADATESGNRQLQYQLFRALTVWLKRAAPVLDAALSSLPPGPFGWICSFDDNDVTDPTAPVPNRDQAAALLELNVDGNVIRIRARKGFLLSFRNPTNVGEALLVETFIRGANALAGRAEFDGIDELKALIIPDEWARDIHFFTARQFRDFVQGSISRKPVLITEADSAYSKLGLGWRARERSDGPWIRGIYECCMYLERVVDTVWEEVQNALKGYNREALIFRLFENHEATMIESERWLRTARSVLSFHRNKERTEAESAMRLAVLNASSLGARLLAEMALCECPESGGEEIGELDLARLLASAMQMHILGGWSDAIRYGGKAAEIKVATFGDILSAPDFDDKIATPYGQALGMKRFRMGASGYERNFNAAAVAESAKDAFPKEFWEAWQETFGFSIDELRVFLDNIDDEGVRKVMFAFVCTQDELNGMNRMGKVKTQTVERILEALTLRARASWASTPPGFSAKDWYPWGFRRRLSLIARPIVQLPGDPARYLIAPSMVRSGAVKVVGYCLDGGFDAKDFPVGRMRSWIGAAESKRGRDFNDTVAARLGELGWETRSNIKLTEVLNSKLDKNYGDIDVLAWRGERILAIECKDLELAMTVGDIARQLHEFRGEEVNGKADRLKKHINRFHLLQSRSADVRRFTKSPDNAQAEMCLVFSDLVPMNFSDLAREKRVRIVSVDELGSI